ncbi:hypothetical protein [Frigoriglobus tundricola]|uniref:Uncharacterized protein n=1 Tax=Frigoriglobus tundricola TaxID=2774151 RepID=A0A6M5YUJ4_9BACT|nr:hypothetical protein [Frigoriglobus tundricola]QJW97767.1 hypothetical protein FTUN_5345 [Frigoriglobus tundricola]
MDLQSHDRLRAWLGLPADGPWPPDHYALLGLVRGSGDLADIEARVLDRMELLRPHQLLHPEPVTEGMNRLAQALVCLTDPVGRADYDRELGIPAAPFEVVESEPAASEPLVEVPFEPGLVPPDERRSPAYEVVQEPPPLPYEVVPTEPKGPPPLPSPRKTRRRPARGSGLTPIESTSVAPISRRAVYRRLAALRKALRAWENLRPVLGTPTELLATPVSVLLFVRALADARHALPEVKWAVRGPGTPGGVVAALVRLPHAIHAVRVLVPSQRQTVALDWRNGLDELRRERKRLRELAFIARPRRSGGAAARLVRELTRTPEWCLAGFALAALVFAFLRRNP